MRSNRGGLRIVGAAALIMAITVLAACTSAGADVQSEVPSAAAGTVAPATAEASGSAAASAVGGRSDYDYGSAATAKPSAAQGPKTVRLDAATGSGLTFLTGEAGLTLYTFEPDSPSTSACTGDCADAWPPLTIGAEDTLEAGDGATGALTTLRRDDGTVQVAYDGAPLYYFAGDTSSGDTNGQGAGDAWFVAEP